MSKVSAKCFQNSSFEIVILLLCEIQDVINELETKKNKKIIRVYTQTQTEQLLRRKYKPEAILPLFMCHLSSLEKNFVRAWKFSVPCFTQKPAKVEIKLEDVFTFLKTKEFLWSKPLS